MNSRLTEYGPYYGVRPFGGVHARKLTLLNGELVNTWAPWYHYVRAENARQAYWLAGRGEIAMGPGSVGVIALSYAEHPGWKETVLFDQRTDPVQDRDTHWLALDARDPELRAAARKAAGQIIMYPTAAKNTEEIRAAEAEARLTGAIPSTSLFPKDAFDNVEADMAHLDAAMAAEEEA